MPNKDFLEDYSLFRKFKVEELPLFISDMPKVSINMECFICESKQTFCMINDYHTFPEKYDTLGDKKLQLIYQCQACRNFIRQFHIHVSPSLDYIYKFGQYPEWEIKMDKNIEKVLGKHAKIFRKGLVCESQSYGIGAFSYYRRIIEEIIDELLDSIEDLMEEKDKALYHEALQKTKGTRVTQEKIDLVKDLLPPMLKPNGMNPLGVLHSELSEGLHAESDESCLENATHVKSILVFLINQIIQSKEAAKGFTESMKSLLDKKAKK